MLEEIVRINSFFKDSLSQITLLFLYRHLIINLYNFELMAET